MKAKLILREKHVLPDGSIVEMVIWKVSRQTPERPHGVKYRLYYGFADGSCVVRYDNEAGKGDHRHYGDVEEPYYFIDLEELVSDFLGNVARQGGPSDEKEN